MKTFALLLFALSFSAQAVVYNVPPAKDPYIAIGNVYSIVGTINADDENRCKHIDQLDDVVTVLRTFPDSFLMAYTNSLTDQKTRLNVGVYAQQIQKAAGNRALLAAAKNSLLMHLNCSKFATYK